MAADWEEIRRLAADFQRAQFADTVQRLSERNCIEIVAKLIEDKQLDVVHTLDGKEYITPAQISREIRDELYIRGGRVNIVDLQQVINVDLVHVESRANDIAKSDRNTQLVLGQLIDETYLDRLAEEVNDKLQEVGQVHVAELCKTYDLPGDFLTEVLSQRLGRIIQGQMDEYNRGVIFTQTFIARHRARICGLFSAMTRPTQLNHLINLYGFQEHLLYYNPCMSKQNISISLHFDQSDVSRLDCLIGSWEGAKTWTAGGVPKDQIPVTCCVLGLEASFPELCFPVRLKFSRVKLTLLEKPPCNHAVLEELVNSSRLRGSVVGGRQDKAVFIPDIYSKTQSSWVDSFLEQNRYLEFDALNRLGIPDPVGYIKKRFRGRKLLFLQASCVDQAIIQQVEASVEEAVNSGTWIDVQPLVPSCLSSEDVGILVNEVMRTANVQSSARLLCGTVVVSEKFISSCLTFFEQSMQQKAQKEIKNNPVFLISEDDLKQNPTLADTAPPGKKDRKEERRKKAAEGSGSTKAGGGGNAREFRIRKTKKKGRRDEESDEEVATAPQGRNKQAEVPFMSHEQVEAVLQEQVCDCPEEMISELAGHILRPLTRLYQEVVRAAFLSSSGAGPGAGRKQNVKELQEEISNLYNNIRLFEKGAKLFPDETQASIAKHVLKTVCTDMTNVLLTFAAAEFMSAVESPGSVTSEVRMRILGKLPEDTKGPLMKLHNSLNGRSIEDFLTHLEPSVEVCGFMLKKGDKKRERQALFQHRQALTEQLRQTEDPALVLHLTCVLLFQLSSQCALHAPGRCVPQIISALTGRIPEDQQRLLSQYQALVVKQLVSHSRKLPQGETEGDSGGPHGDDMDAVRKELLSLTNEVKDLVLSPRKTSVTED